MFDIWIDDINITTLVLIFTAAVILPIQLWLCFKVRPLVIRMAPIIILILITVMTIVMNLDTTGWDGLILIFAVIYIGFMLLMCGVGWAIWMIVNYVKKR